MLDMPLFYELLLKLEHAYSKCTTLNKHKQLLDYALLKESQFLMLGSKKMESHNHPSSL